MITFKKFLILLGVSIGGFFVFVVLHNLISAILSRLFNAEIEEPVFFILAVIVCPVGAMVGVVGSVFQMIKMMQKRKIR
jgi:hypothetical protein